MYVETANGDLEEIYPLLSASVNIFKMPGVDI